ncbi:MAG TPA: protein kinase, partial [Gemmatimonadales bacterium]|nr:protein kinase [Gemmatimonadales bacterium]
MTLLLDRLQAALSGRYQIERELGRGGMATVYLADDLRHGRTVAIKLLHAELSAVLGPERFLTEIKTTAALQHPHILPLFDSGAADGLLYYVMPHVEGETLRQRLERERQLPVSEAVRIASEVADALDYAHRHGVVHRDVKPENILLGYPRDRGASAGHALVADFGIALAVQQAGGHRLTETGLSLGTPHYMAPEQATGERHIDARADVYALGAVTYEMLAGVPPFTGPTAQAVIAKVLTERPRPLRELRDTVPHSVAAAVHSALEKLPADRPGDAADFARRLTEPVVPMPATSRAAAAHRWLKWAAAAAAIALAAGVGYAIGHRDGRANVSYLPPTRLALLTPNLEGSGVAGLHRQLALTPDGQSVVFVVQSADGETALAGQRLDATEASLIQGGLGLMDPQPSPDGRWLVAWGTPFRRGGTGEKTFRLSSGGGTAVQLPADVDVRFAAWSSDGSLWFTSPNSGVLRRLSPDGRVSPVLGDRSLGLRIQQVIEPGPWGLMVRAPLGNLAGPVVMLGLENGEQVTVVEEPVVEARYAVGLLVYARQDGVLFAVPFDPSRRQLRGAPVQIATGVSVTGSGIGQFAVAPNGTVAYIPEEPRSLVFADRSGAFRPASPERRNYHAPEFSPDGKRLSVDFTGSDGRDVWVFSLAQGTLSRATFDRDGHDAVWSRDGRYLSYTSLKSGALGIYRVRPGSAEPPESLFATARLGYTGRWLPDGKALISTGSNLSASSGADIMLVPNGGRGPIQPLIVNQFQTTYPMPSPDGRWFAYVSNQSGE